MAEGLEIVFEYLGAFVRWIFNGFKGRLIDNTERGDSLRDTALGAVMFVLLITAVIATVYYFKS